MLNIRKWKAFTLIELIVVVIIVGVLALIASVAYNQFVGQGRVSANLASAKNVAQAIDVASAQAGDGTVPVGAMTIPATDGPGVYTVGTVAVPVPKGTTVADGVVSIAGLTSCTVTPPGDTSGTALVACGEGATPEPTTTTTPPLAAPVLSGTHTGQTNTLTWTAPDGADSYDLYRVGTVTAIYAGTALTFGDASRPWGGTSAYYVSATNTGGTSANSNTATLITDPLAAPAAPALSGTHSGQTNTLTWTAPTGADSYDLYRVGTVTAIYSGTALTFGDASRPWGGTTAYYVSATNTGGTSASSNTATLITDPPPDPLAGVAIGDAFMGGYFAGVIDTTTGNIIAADASQVGSRYALIVSPKSLDTALAYKTANNAAPASSSTRWNGLAATAAMTGATYPAANYCNGLSYPGDGGSQWYLPAMDEMELVYRNLKPTTEVNYTTAPVVGMFPPTSQSPGVNPSSSPAGVADTSGAPAQTALTTFRVGGAQALAGVVGTHVRYWSATEYSTTGAWAQFVSGPYAGYQANYSKSSNNRVRPVRRFVL